jgi:hypothetical protein
MKARAAAAAAAAASNNINQQRQTAMPGKAIPALTSGIAAAAAQGLSFSSIGHVQAMGSALRQWSSILSTIQQGVLAS